MAEAVQHRSAGNPSQDKRAMVTAVAGHQADGDDAIPLVVDLDGTLLRTDLLHECFLDAIGRHGWQAVDVRQLPAFSRSAVKAHLAGLAELDYADLPYRPEVLGLILAAKAEGRKIYLATASFRSLAEGIAAHLDCFDGVFATDAANNLKGARKAERLTEAFGETGFDYIGNDAADLPVWRQARQAISVDAPASVRHALDVSHALHRVAVERDFDPGAIMRAMRPHQYVKNALIFVPLLTAHAFSLGAAWHAALAFLAFSICASAVYVINDLLDLQADRRHPSKRLRPFAAGNLPVLWGAALAPGLLAAALAIGWAVSPKFLLVLAGYFGLTTFYSFILKKRMIVDVVTLASLYTIRIFAGAAAIDVVVSQWLFTFSLMMFASLALTKRYVELANRLDRGLPDPDNRDYRLTDLPVVMALAAAAGMSSITVIALWVNSPEVTAAYGRHQVLWALCPLFLYWISRILMLAHRRMVDDDPISFALRDSRSIAVGLLSVIVVLGAI